MWINPLLAQKELDEVEPNLIERLPIGGYRQAHHARYQQAVRCLRIWGRACFVGEGGDVTLDVSNDLLRRQISLLGSWTFSLSEQQYCAEFVAKRGLDLGRLFTDRWSREEAGRLTSFDRQSGGKGVICPA